MTNILQPEMSVFINLTGSLSILGIYLYIFNKIKSNFYM